MIQNNSKITELVNVANTLNDHFVTAGMKARKQIKSSQLNPLDYVKRVENNMLLGNITEMEIVKIVHKLKNKHSSGVDGLSNVFLKRVVNAIKIPLCMVVNSSLNSGIFPESLKHAKVCALHKGGDRYTIDNYRPISLLPVISKVIERYIYLRLVSHMDDNDVTYVRQFGFRKKHSTTDAFMLAVGEILSAFSENFSLLSVFIDLRKAFDTVDHSIILKKLEKIGVRDNALQWFTSYLHGRSQQVLYHDCFSSEKKIQSGVPQGSLLGVILFQLHINSLKCCLKQTTVILYADDTMIYAIGRNMRALKCKVQSDLNNLSMWLNANKLLLNVTKTKSLLFSHSNCTVTDLKVNGQVIQDVKCFKFLGYYLDKSLSFEHHVYHLCNSLLNSIFLIRKLSTFIPKYALRTLYYAHYFSRINYGVNIWFPLLKEADKVRLIQLQKRIIRVINLKGPLVHSQPLFKLSKILSVQDMVKLENVKLIYRVKSKLVALPIINLFPLLKHQYNTRRYSLEIPQHKLKMYNLSFIVRAIVDWDLLKPEVKQKSSLNSFVNCLKQSMLDAY